MIQFAKTGLCKDCRVPVTKAATRCKFCSSIANECGVDWVFYWQVVQGVNGVWPVRK
jgi:hypothetical protein